MPTAGEAVRICVVGSKSASNMGNGLQVRSFSNRLLSIGPVYLLFNRGVIIFGSKGSLFFI